MSTKTELRRELMARRRALSPEEVAATSRAVLEELQRVVDWSSVGSVHVYRSVAEWGELDTSELVAWLEDEHPHVEVVQPTLSKDQPFPERDFDVILVPALGFDHKSNRLGLGGGWYDRFVAQQPQARKIGVAYAWAKVKTGIPVEPWDMKLDLVVTDAGSPGPDDNWWRSFHEEHGVPNPGNYSVGGFLGMFAGLITALFPRPLRGVVKWPIIILVLLAWLLVYLPLYFLFAPVRWFRHKRRSAAPNR